MTHHAAVPAAQHPPDVTRAPVDAVGHAVAVGDTVLALLGSSGARGVVEQVSPDRAVVRRDGDGFKAVLRTASLVVQRRVDRAGQGTP